MENRSRLSLKIEYYCILIFVKFKKMRMNYLAKKLRKSLGSDDIIWLDEEGNQLFP